MSVTPRLRRRYTDPNTAETFVVEYTEGRMLVSDGLREVAVVPYDDHTAHGYRLKIEDTEPPKPVWQITVIPTAEAGLSAACDWLYTQPRLRLGRRRRDGAVCPHPSRRRPA